VAGFIKVDRDLIDHPALKSKQRDSYTAFLWLVREAAISTKAIGYGRHAVRLDRGQVSHSVRHLAQAWNWPRMKVHRFLQKLSAEGLIQIEKVIPLCDESGTVAGTAESIITICNYDEFSGSMEEAGQPLIQECDTTGTSNKNLRIKEQKESLPVGEIDHSQPDLLGGEVVAMPASEVQVAFDAYRSVAKELGLRVPTTLQSKVGRQQATELRRRLKEKDWEPTGRVGLEAWALALEALRNAKFITSGGWKGFSLDDMVTRKKLENLMAGRYNNLWQGGTVENPVERDMREYYEQHPGESFFHQISPTGKVKL
jgi:hypothetical protein